MSSPSSSSESQSFEHCPLHKKGWLLAEFFTPGDNFTAPGRFILIARKSLFDPSQNPFITWWENMQDDACYWGHYFDKIEDAQADFLARCTGSKYPIFTQNLKFQGDRDAN